MIALTSISPKHINDGMQKHAVDSWVALGMKVVSMNNKSEIELIKEDYPNVEFVATHRTMEKLYKRPLVNINALIDYAKDQDEDQFMIINSDIIIKDVHGMLPSIKGKMDTGVTMVKRRDFEHDINQSRVFESGIDIFFIHKKFLNIFAQGVYCIGECWWDYWIPYTIIENGIPLHKLNEAFAFHKMHNIQYDMYKWGWISEYFKWEKNIKGKNAGQLNQHVFKYIHDHLT